MRVLSIVPPRLLISEDMKSLSTGSGGREASGRVEKGWGEGRGGGGRERCKRAGKEGEQCGCEEKGRKRRGG